MKLGRSGMTRKSLAEKRGIIQRPQIMAEKDPFKTPCEITWCSGCGNFGIWTALKNAFSELGWGSDDVLIVYGIGCHAHMVNYLETFGFEGLHGRALPVATGAKIANYKLNVIAVAGDGDQLGEGGNHFIHTARRNSDITCIIHDNQLYSLTVGQASPTSEKSIKTRSTPEGVIEEPLNPLTLAIASGASFVARGFSGDIKHLTKIFVQGIQHKGFSVIDVLQPCVTLNHLNTYQWFQKRVYKLEDSKHSPKNKLAALKKSLEWGNKIPTGIFFKTNKPTLEEGLALLKEKPLVEQSIEKINIEKLLKEFS